MNRQPARNKLNALFLLLPLLVLFARAEVEAAGFRLIYNNDNLGELDGCG